MASAQRIKLRFKAVMIREIVNWYGKIERQKIELLEKCKVMLEEQSFIVTCQVVSDRNCRKTF